MVSGPVRTVYEKKTKKRTYNGKNMPQTKPSKVICRYCWKLVAPYDKQVKTNKGIAHYNCVIDQTFQRIQAIKLPHPPVFSLGRDFQKYLVEQANMLLLQPVEDAEYKLIEVLDISEEIFGKQIKLSKLMARQSQGLSP